MARERQTAAIVIMLAVLAPAAGSAAAAHRHPAPKKRAACAPHLTRVRGRCVARLVRVSGTTLGALRQGAMSMALGAGQRLPVVSRRAYRHVPAPLRHGVPRLLTDRGASNVLARLAMSAGGAARSVRAAAAAGLNGWSTHLENERASDNRDRIGSQDAEATAVAEKSLVANGLDFHGEIKLTEHRRELVDRCPSLEGAVPGDAIESFKLSLAASVGGSELSGVVDLEPTFTYVGHVDDSGKLRSFDARMHLVALAYWGTRGSDGRLYSEEPPNLYVIDTQIDDVNPDDPTPPGRTYNEHLGGRMVFTAFLGQVIWQDGSAAKLAKLAPTLFELHLRRAAELFKQAEQYWQSPGSCVNVVLAASNATVAANATVPVTATITGLRQAAGHLAPGAYTSTASAGVLTPDAGRYASGPVSLTFTAPLGGDPVLTMTTQSRQGKGLGTLYLHVASRYALRYTTSGQLDYDGPPEQVAAAPRTGTENRHEQWALSSTIPLTGDPATGLSGTAPLTYSTARYHRQWQGTFTGQATCNGTDTKDLTGTSPGSAQVVKLTIGSPTTVSLRFDTGEQPGLTGSLPPAPSETYHEVQTFDVCPGATHTPTESHWNSSWNYFYEQRMMDASGVVVIDSGWQPGSGNIVATRTITGSFPWGGAPGVPATSTWTDTYQVLSQSPSG